MKRLLLAGVLALPALLAAESAALAQPGCIPPPGYGGGLPPGGCDHFYGCRGFCFRFLGAIHQHGPLYNYGPYTGYYPFEPYGPWNAALQYTGPYPSSGACGWNGLCAGKCGGKCGAKCGLGGCKDGWGRYADCTYRNVKHRLFPLFHRHKDKGGASCDDCAGGCAAVAGPAGAVAATPTADPIQQTSYPRSER